MESRKIKRYGWKPSLPDIRDYVSDLPEVSTSYSLPRSFDLLDFGMDKVPIYDQGNLGSCTANAVAAAAQYWFFVHFQSYTELHQIPSRLMIYYGEREIEGSIDYDAGAYGRDGFKFVRNVGVASEDLWPYDIDKFADKPSSKAYDEAKFYKIPQYVALRRSQIRTGLVQYHQPCAFGFTVYESFESEEADNTGVIPMPSPGESVLGGHEMLIVGYEYIDDVLHFKCRNSWGDGWGDSGYAYMPRDYIVNSNLSSDFRAFKNSVV